MTGEEKGAFQAELMNAINQTAGKQWKLEYGLKNVLFAFLSFTCDLQNDDK